MDDTAAKELNGGTGSLTSVMVDVCEASGLANRYYTDPDCFEDEKHRVFFAGWSGIGFAKDVPEPGCVVPLEFLGMPLLLVRDKTGRVRVFQNTCRHRGMILIDRPTRLKGVIRCPYHSWCYGLDGALRTTPHVGGPGRNIHEAIDRDVLGLFEFRSHVWHDVVFVNVSGDAPAFEVANAALLERWSEFDQPLYHAGEDCSIRLEVATNWKLAVENYCESYHLPWIHPGLNSYSRLEDHYNIVEYGQYSGQGTLVYRPTLDPQGRRFPDFAELSEKWNKGAEYITLFPNVMLGVHRDHVYAILLEPDGPTRTIERIEIYYAAPEAIEPDFADLRRANKAQWSEIFDEDVAVCEGMQRGRHGAKFDGGKFSPVMDVPTHVFHHWVAGRLSGPPPPPPPAHGAEGATHQNTPAGVGNGQQASSFAPHDVQPRPGSA